ncbi:lysozyme [Paraburkholderia unamae]|uniref:Lysozyme n=1 Tax=Paraburkholderia unamae TaxID=219649 RepID=A0ACC6RGR3_9BURK
MNDYTLTVADLSITKQAESCRLVAYQDPVGIWTCGWGCTGPDIVAGTQWSQDEADARLLAAVASAETQVRAALKFQVTREEFIALVDFTYNVGCGNFDHSTLLAKINAGDMAGAAQEFLKWDLAGGRVLQGLLVRRQAEMKEFMTGWGDS